MAYVPYVLGEVVADEHGNLFRRADGRKVQWEPRKFQAMESTGGGAAGPPGTTDWDGLTNVPAVIAAGETAAAARSVIDPNFLYPIGSAADGSTNDMAAFDAISSDTPGTIQLRRGKTYKLAGHLTLDHDLDMNGATLDITGHIDLNGFSIWDGTINLGGSAVLATGKSNFRVDDLVINVGSPTNVGLSITSCAFFTSKNVTVNGECWRGVLIDRCDDWKIEDTHVNTATASGAYGILAASGSDGVTHYRGRIIRPKCVDCYSGVTFWGGTAHPDDAAYTGLYTWEDVSVVDAVVIINDADADLLGGVWSSNCRNLTYVRPTLHTGRDVGLDFEHCIDSRCLGGTVNNIKSGGISVLFGSINVKFYDVSVVFDREDAPLFTASGATWANTSNWQGLFRNDPINCGAYRCSFKSVGGALGQIALSGGSVGLELVDCTGLNVYVAGANTTVGGVTDTLFSGLNLQFDINLNAPAIFHQLVNRFTVEDCKVTLPAGEVPFANTRPYIGIYESGTDYSDYVYMRRNTVSDPNNGSLVGSLGIVSGGDSINAWFTDNTVDRIVGQSTGNIKPNFRYARNVGRSSMTAPRLTGHTSASTFIPIKQLESRAVISTSTTPLTMLGDSSIYEYTGATNATWTLPLLSDSPVGSQLTVRNMSTTGLTVQRQGSDMMFTRVSTTSVFLYTQASASFVNDGTSWVLMHPADLSGFPHVATVTTTSTLAVTNEMVFANGTSITLSLPDPVNANQLHSYIVKNINSTSCVVNSAGTSKTIDGATSVTLAQYETLRVRPNGLQWYKV